VATKKTREIDRWKTILIGALLSICIAGIVVVFIYGYDPGTTPTCTTSNASIHIKRELYELCHNWQTKQPSWVLQFYEGIDSEVVHTKSVNFYSADPEIPQNDQASIEDYDHSDWVLGNYLFPFSKQAMELTDARKKDQYFFSVTSPQDPNFHYGYWRKLREYAQTRASKSFMPSYIGVLSGPLFLLENKNQNLRLLEPNHIPVPTHFFQVIIPNANENDIEAYIVPNQKIAGDVSLEHFKVSLEHFEKITGIKEVKRIVRSLNVSIPVL
jgi:DNA/RNA endonuclease G (NUC1)